jgi:hypothetical protein
MSAREPSVHSMTLLQQSATGGAFTNSGARTAGGLENIGTATSNTFTAVEIIQIQETVSASAGGGPGGSSAPPYDGGEPSSYQGESLSFSHPSSSSHNPTNFVLAPDIKLSCTVVNSVVAGVGTATTTSAITGPVREMDDWVIPWTPKTSIPKFNGSDFATTRSAGYGRENSIFTVTIELEYGLIAFSSFKQTKTWTIGIINNADNDKDVYIAAYREAYGSLTKVPELSERAA